MSKATTLVGVCLLIGLVATLWYSVLDDTRTSSEITVDRMWTKMHTGAGDVATEKYLVSDTDGNVYMVTDVPSYRMFDASDRWAQLDVGKAYNIVTIGWRVTAMSMYPNIVEITEV